MRLEEKYKKQILPAMMEKFNCKNKMAVPKLSKVIINSGFGNQVAGKGAGDRDKIAQVIVQKLALIVGQQPVLAKAKKSISSFKLREGVVIGAKATLRGKRAYQFLEKLIYLILPRQRDFRGIDEKAVTPQGNLTIGFKEYTPFPEVKIEKEKGLFGLEITIVTTAQTKEEGIELLKLMGLPFKK